MINNILRKFLDIHELEQFDDNYKSQLLEWCQKNNKEVSYRVINKFKHNKQITITGQDNLQSSSVVNNELILMKASNAIHQLSGFGVKWLPPPVSQNDLKFMTSANTPARETEHKLPFW